MAARARRLPADPEKIELTCVDRPRRPESALHVRRPGDPDSGLGPLTILRTPTDIFPNINIPVVTVVWNYSGMSADEMADRIVSPSSAR